MGETVSKRLVIVTCSLLRSSRHDLCRVALTHLFDADAELFIAGGEYLGGEDARVDRTRVADGDGGDWNASGHLDGREERVEPTGDRVRCDERHADHRKRSERRDRAGEVRRTAGTTDHDADATPFEPLDPVTERLGGAMRGKDSRLALHAEALEGLGCEAHRGLVGRGAHDDRDLRCHQATATSCCAMSER